MKALIHDLRFGIVDPMTLTDTQIVKLLDYCLPSDVIGLLTHEVCRRRDDRIEALRLLEGSNAKQD